MLVKIYASGTNIGRLARCSSKNQFVIAAPYCELEATEPGIIQRRCYILNITEDMIALIETLDEDKRPSFTKIWDRPEQNKAYIVEYVRSLFGYNPLRPNLILSQFTGEHITCVQLWISADKSPMAKAGKIIKEALPDWRVVVINGDHTTGKKAEDFAKKEIEAARRDGKHGILFITSIMTQRSWGVPEVQCCVMAYDKGSSDVNSQKSSRPLTPGLTFDGEVKKYGYIVDTGFNTNRSDKIEGIVLTDTLARMHSEEEDYPTALRYTTSSINVFTVNEYGYPVKIAPEEMFETMSDEEVILRVADSSGFDMSNLNKIIDIIAMVKGGDKATQAVKDALVSKVKNSILVSGIRKKGLTNKEKKDEQALINKARRALNQSATSVVFMADKYDFSSYRAALLHISKSKAKNAEFKDFIGIDALNAIELLDLGFLPEMLLDSVVDASCRMANSMNLFGGK